jgi:hypothetical protein
MTSIALSLRLIRIARHFVGELVDHVEHVVFAAIMGAILDKVVGPDVMRMFGP